MTPEAMAALAARAYRHGTAWSATAFADTLARPEALLGLSGDAAFALGLVIADEAEILAVACDPTQQRQGHAARALAQLHAAATGRGAGTVFLEVAAGNASAIAFYARHGYVVTGRRRGYYRTPDGGREDALLMVRALP
ncbi:GNAT family N-acetyltransferase [Pseudoponticoccus marisrubri]|uniref:Ribosomal-protein-alanine acetyltransferase n=1 Tax=Pseudoponticoccus marisrubri TaxID=1685382 RepID=A0A0W7WQC6_9RHOB|nr:GNAT family N-acetyltransferase [Pseudoponticoccus marisrubri]KUF12777.1 ribosomal-protein-alanine acetyltransferase [Pseudoponticoccus marisrubri]